LRKTKEINSAFSLRLNLYKAQMQNYNGEDTDLKSFTFDFLDGEGHTPLHYACQSHNIKCAEFLIFKKGCGIDVCATNGLRPRDLI
jgi:ankyrin repeat protein